MCRRIVKDAVERAVGCFNKRLADGPEGMTQRFEVLVAPCECGQTFYARVPNGTVWVESEREENREVGSLDAAAFAEDIEKVTTK